MKTKDGLHVYDLDPMASELWAVAGPAGHDIKAIDPDNLPPGFRWITEPEWQEILAIRDMARDWARHEFDCFIEQGRDYRAWTPGQWSGRQLSDADERTLDKLAAEHWETLWNTKANVDRFTTT